MDLTVTAWAALVGRDHQRGAEQRENRERCGYEVTDGVGGTGVVGRLAHGEGSTVMLRANMDALPVEEGTRCTSPGSPAPTTAPGSRRSSTRRSRPASWR